MADWTTTASEDVSDATQEGTPRVFIVEDDEPARRSLIRLVESVQLQSAAFETAEAFLEAFDMTQPGCVVLDVRMPGMSGLELQEALLRQGAEIPIIVITGHADVPMAVRAMKSNAFEFFEKPYSAQAMLDTIHRAIRADAENREQAATRDEIIARIESLTPREKQVMDGIVEGKLNKQIAADLDISERTVEDHRARVMEKMSAVSVASLVRQVMSINQSSRP